MSQLAQVNASQEAAGIERVVMQGDLSQLTSEQRLAYYKRLCEDLKLNPLTQPFDYIKLNGKLVLYAKRDCTDQLRRIHEVSIVITSRELMGEVYVVTARASLPSGRTDESTGAVPVGSLKGEALSNAYLKAETKAKRRVTLSIIGLGYLDETEVETIPGAVIGPAAEEENRTPISLLLTLIERATSAEDLEKRVRPLLRDSITQLKLPKKEVDRLKAIFNEKLLSFGGDEAA